MAHVEVSKLSSHELAELACTYAALILHDDSQDITGDKIATVVKAAGVNIESYWPKLFARAIQGQDVSSFFNFGGQVTSGPAASEPAKTAPVAEKKAEEKGGKKQQKKKEAPPPPPPEEQDMDMGDLFG